MGKALELLVKVNLFPLELLLIDADQQEREWSGYF